MKAYKKGWRNNYNASLSFFEIIGKDVKFFFKDSKKRIANRGKLPVIVVSPDFPSKRTTIFKIADALNFRLTNQLVKNPDVVLYFEDITHGNSDAVTQNYPNKKVINKYCVDISKKIVDRIHLEVFGYNTTIDPLSYQGIAVEKSDENALHDGRKLQCPIAKPREQAIYQMLIDNDVDEQYVVDYRVPVIHYEVPLVYKKFKEKKVRFTNEVSYSELHVPDMIFSNEELKRIGAFAKAMQAEFCELDVLRHSDGRIFVIDVNKTPYGPPAGLQENKKAVELLTRAFQRAFLEK
ncbi:MAG: hypothetical protein ACK50N_05010 [Flavobacteriales bacterium]|jgi:hypothetical protein